MTLPEPAAAGAQTVIIGNGMAGAVVAEEIRAIDKTAHITMFGDEPHVNYNRILLSDVLSGKRSVREIVLNPREWYDKNGIDLRTGARVAGIDSMRRIARDAAGTETPYDRLVIAVGGAPFMPPIAGADKDGVFCFRNLDDCERIIARAGRSAKAVVIGGGLLGLEAARGLVNHGLEVTVVHLADRIMELQLDGIGADILKRSMERMGIDFMLSTTADEILGDGRVSAVRLKSGATLDADLVLICTGIRPNLELAQSAGLETRRGLVVDDQMRTSQPDIYAVGDVVEHRGKVYGFIDPIREQSKVAADAIVGKGLLRYAGTVCATILKVAGIAMSSAGHFTGGPGYEEIVFIDSGKGLYKKLILQRNRVIGMILLGDNKDGQELFNLIKSGRDISDKKEHLQALIGDARRAQSAGTAVVTAPSDSDQICNCNSVSRGTIVKAIRDKGLKSVDEIARATKATTGCGSCASLCDRILKDALGAPLETAVDPARARRIPPAAVPPRYPRVLPVEKIKQEGLALDWSKIKSQGVFALSEDDFYRLKMFGVCGQKHPGFFMMRIRIPAGRVTARQLEALADAADMHGRGWGHLTTRQDMELHWVKVEEAPAIWDILGRAGISSRSSCGHTLRNVMACPHAETSVDSPVHSRQWAEAISTHFVERSEFINPRMPNRLNIFFGGCAECAAEAQINDIGFAPVRRGGAGEVGFEAWVGGSLGANPILGFKIREFISERDVLPVCQAVFEIHMKHGMREKGKSRLKFLIEKWGREKFCAEFDRVMAEKRGLPENRLFQIPPARELPRSDPRFMRVEIDVPLGDLTGRQIRDIAMITLKHGMGEAVFTKEQNIEIPRARSADLKLLTVDLDRAGLTLKDRKRGLRVTACVGTEFCVLAVTNSQGAARDILKRYAPDRTAKRDLLNGLTVSISGCPNSCAKQQVADIGLVGSMSAVGEEKRFTYTMTVGGYAGAGPTGPRVAIGRIVRKKITEDMVAPTLDALLDIAIEIRTPHESFPATMDRIGAANVEKMLEERLSSRPARTSKRVMLVPEKADIA